MTLHMIWDTDAGVLTLHQSDIKHFLTCPEQFRVSYLMGLRTETDAALIGTGLHHVIETELVTGKFKGLPQAKRFGRAWYSDQISEFHAKGTEFRRSSYRTDERAFDKLDGLVELWWSSNERHDLLSGHVEYEVEWEFDMAFDTFHPAWSPKPIEIRLAGKADIVTPDLVVDWKSASREYQRWEKQRWDVQAPVYTWAAQEAGILKANEEGLYDFRFKVFVHGAKEVQTVPVLTSPGKFKWLSMQVRNMAWFICDEHRMEAQWPLRDDHALCGPKWCPLWDTCKGSVIDGNLWV